MPDIIWLEIALGVIPILVAHVIFQYRVVSHLKYIIGHTEHIGHIKTRTDDMFDKMFKE